ncbi:MAG: hypothetical protein ACRDSP_00640 [Pseudonocardiaceae bacterium]
MPYVNLRPSQVLLDPENPRLPDGTSSDREAINRLLDDGAEALISLARDLARTGQTNPAELPIAIKSGSKYLVLEGNRRFAALKLLKDPTLADNDEHRKAFRRAAALGNPPTSVYTLVTSSREEADHWIVLRHTGENNGTGIKRWSAAQAATHRRRANRPIDSGTLRSITIADELEEAYASDNEIVELVRRTRRKKLTNIGRFFSLDVLNALHFTLREDDGNSLRPQTLLVRHSADELRNFFVWALSYIADKPVDAYKNFDIRRDALRSVAHLIPSLTDAADEPFRLTDSRSARTVEHGAESSSNEEVQDDQDVVDDDGESAASSDGNGTDVKQKQHDPSPEDNEVRRAKKKSEPKPERYLLQGLRLPNHPERIQRLLRECRSLDLTESPGIACVMLRVIVELSVSSPQALTVSGELEGVSLKNKIVAMLRYLDPDIESPIKRDKELAQAYLEASDVGVQYLHGFVHNVAVYPDQHLARRFSGAFRPLLVRVDGVL